MNRLHKNLFFLIIMLLALQGCGEKFGEDEKEDPGSFAIETIETGPFIYNTVLSFPKMKKFTVLKTNLSTDDGSGILAKSVSTEYIDTDVQSGFTYEYRIGSGSSDEFIEVFKKKVTIPLDIISSLVSEFPSAKIANLSKAKGYEYFEVNNLVLYENKPLATNGRKIHLKVKKLVANNGSISTFPDGLRAGIGVEGRSGGEIIIHAEQAVGNITFVMRGELGGQGVEPDQLGEEGRGATGDAGSEGAQHTVCADDPSGVCSTECVRDPGDGEAGGQGKPGLKANNGFPGGNTGRVFLQIKDSSNLEVQVQKIAGLGGFPSKGGRGGPGGYGGPSGSISHSMSYGSPVDSNDECFAGYDGAIGPEGPRGPSASIGVSGITEKSCQREDSNDAWQCNL